MENLMINAILKIAPRFSIYRKLKPSICYEFEIYQQAVKSFIELGGVLKKDFKVYTHYFEPVLKKIDIKKIIENYDYQQHILFNMARIISISKSFSVSGKNIFVVRKEFLQLLNQTDFPEEVKVEMFKLPYCSFHLVMEELYYETKLGRVYLDEIFVSYKEDDRELLLELVFFEKMKPKEDIKNHLGVDKGLAFSYISISIDKDKSIKELYEKIYKEIQTLYSEKLPEEEKPVIMPIIDDVVNLYSKISRVFINLILYLNYIKEDITINSKVPKKLIDRREYYLKTNNQKKLEKVEKEINRYTKIYIVGEKAKSYIQSQSSKVGKSKRPHWRRGHIRYYDPNKERKRKFKKQWTFVKPTLVGAKTKKENDNTRIYKI